MSRAEVFWINGPVLKARPEGSFSMKESVSVGPDDLAAEVIRLDTEAITVTTPKRAEPRVAFGQIVERGLLSPGQVLHSANCRHTARIRADGTLVAPDIRGSIHKVGAEVQGAPSCNGWTFWHFRDRQGDSVQGYMVVEGPKGKWALTGPGNSIADGLHSW